jgi:hypothetical protein
VNRPPVVVQASPNLLAKGGAGAGYEYAARDRREYCCASHVTDFTRGRLEDDWKRIKKFYCGQIFPSFERADENGKDLPSGIACPANSYSGLSISSQLTSANRELRTGN